MWHKSQLLDGALKLLHALKDKGVPIALRTSSAKDKYHMKTAHLSSFDFFEHHIVTGDDSRIALGRGKPEPDIWYLCLESINEERRAQGLDCTAMEECLIFEDGIPGVISTKNSNAHVTWVPHPEAVVAMNGKQHEMLPERGKLLASLRDFDLAKYGL